MPQESVGNFVSITNIESHDATLSSKFTQHNILTTNSKRKAECVLVNSNRWRIRWDISIIMLALYSSIATPFSVAFKTSESNLPFDVWEMIVSALFGIDIIVTFRSSYMNKEGIEVVAPKMIAKQYVFSGMFFLDILATFPFEIISDASGSGSGNLGLLRMLKLVRLLRMRRIIVYLKFNTDFKLGLKIFFIIFCTFLYIHICACFWNLIVIQEEDWKPPSAQLDKFYDGNDRSYKYTVDLYYATLMILGADAFAHSTIEVIYVFTMSFFGFVLLSMLFGHMALLVQSLSRKNDALHEQLDRASIAIKHIKLSNSTASKVSSFILNTFSDRDRQEEINYFFTMLSPSLRLEASTFLYSSMLNENGVFANQTDAVNFIIPRLKTHVTNPESIVIERGSVGNEWYYIGKGELQVLTLDNHGDNIVSNMLLPGDYFGEISLLIGCRRTSTVRSRTYCNLAFLNKDYFKELIEVFPSIKAEFMERILSYNDEWRLHVTSMIKCVPYLKNLTRRQLNYLSYFAMVKHLDTGNEIIRRGVIVSEIFFVATGGCSVLVERRRKPKFPILKLHTGSVCFTNTALRDLPSLFTLETSCKSIILSLPISVLKMLDEYIPNLTQKVTVAQATIQTEALPENHDFHVTSAFERGKKGLPFRLTVMKLIRLFQNKQSKRKDFKLANIVDSAMKLEMLKLSTSQHEGEALKEEYERRAKELLVASQSMLQQVIELDETLHTQERELELLERQFMESKGKLIKERVA